MNSVTETQFSREKFRDTGFAVRVSRDRDAPAPASVGNMAVIRSCI